MVVFDRIWSSVGATGGQTAFAVDGQDALEWRMYAEASTGTVTTAVIQIGLSSASTGPWASVVSDTVSTATPVVASFSGPLFGYVRAYSGSTGATIRLVGIA